MEKSFVDQRKLGNNNGCSYKLNKTPQAPGIDVAHHGVGTQ